MCSHQRKRGIGKLEWTRINAVAEEKSKIRKKVFLNTHIVPRVSLYPIKRGKYISIY